MLPLEGILVVEHSMGLAGPFAGVRLADLGARVIRIEQAEEGSLPLISLYRNKERFLYNAACDQDTRKLNQLIAAADIYLDGPSLQALPFGGASREKWRSNHPQLIHAMITSCGGRDVEDTKAYDDLFIQALTGMPWLNGNADDPPIPFPLSTVEMFASANLVQGILAALVHRAHTRSGMLVEVSLLESAIDVQFEVLTTHLNDGGLQPQRSAVSNAHAYLAAPYGVYETSDGYLALAMGSVLELGKLLHCDALAKYKDPASWFVHRDEIKLNLTEHLKSRPASAWEKDLEAGGYWCAEVQTTQDLLQHEGFRALQHLQQIEVEDQGLFVTPHCPIKIDSTHLNSRRGILRAGEDNAAIEEEFKLI
ncbi:CoA transferase [Paenibacillus sp. F411]|uniref:CoA transferase n=1 Tax=Paenibacillus sp. F411 TaxID=2820239 RepID=UPI001AAFA4DA|nr:CaiB/BaiF CoA-transferase family protein [Paenibacillus sp. F411]MBO2943547.1 CoA transferase [Paenibacillus sp. F411]